MSTSAINIYNTQLAYQMGADAPMTVEAIYDPAGTAVKIYGFFDNVTWNTTQSDPSGQRRKGDYKLFVSSTGDDIKLYEDNKILQIDSVNYTIQFIEKDDTGVNKFWLR